MSNKIILILSLLVFAAFVGGSRWAALQVADKNPQAGVPQPTTQPQQEEKLVQILGTQDQQALVEGATITKGNPEAPITIVEFSDYQCPFCSRYTNQTLPQVMAEYGDDIYYVWHDFPLGFHQNAVPAATAARCAGEQDKYWEMHDALFLGQSEWSESNDAKTTFSSYAQDIGLDVDLFNSCMEEEKFGDQIEADLKLRGQFGVNATPTFFINGEKVEGAQPYEVFKEIIDNILAE